MASIHKRGNKYRVIWAVPVNGKRTLRGQTFSTQAEARSFAAARAAEEARGAGGAPQTLGSFLRYWRTTKQPTVKATTYASYLRCSDFVLGHAIAARLLDRVTALHLERFYRDLGEQPTSRGKPLGPRSIHHVHALLQNALNDARRFRLVAENAAAVAKPPKLPQLPPVILSQTMVTTFLADVAQHNAPLLPLAALIASTGMRRGEALGLAIADIDWQRGTASIHQVVEEVAGTWRLRAGTKTTRSQRTIRLVPDIMALLLQQRKAVTERRLKFGAAWTDLGLLFPDMLGGGPMCPATLTRAFRRSARRAGWPDGIASVHGLRHFAASAALAAGGTLAAVSQRLGHSSPQVTASIYLHTESALDEAAAIAMARDLVLPKAGGS